jgi:hypothetical protein
MKADRRYNTRQHLDTPVYIRYRKRRFQGARARAVSVGGMFLEVRALTLPIGTHVELEFTRLGHAWRVPAIVVHRNHDGIGVMFNDQQPDLFRQLLDNPPAILPPTAAGRSEPVQRA